MNFRKLAIGTGAVALGYMAAVNARAYSDTRRTLGNIYHDKRNGHYDNGTKGRLLKAIRGMEYGQADGLLRMPGRWLARYSHSQEVQQQELLRMVAAAD